MSAARTKLAGLVNTVATHAKSVTNVAEKQITTRYSKMMEANKEYVVEDQAKASKLFKQWYYTNMSRIPDNITMVQKEAAELRQTLSKGTHLHVTEVGTLAFFAAEVYAWFVVGEIIGRGGSLVDYDVSA
mmetsp:Transcript_3836/g.11085  ORF Transcript_3836/g.11085 Transcript_3836/m.11085 type:complete len:130 (-) Transcript_3836:372-761(-)|eukprot:CAMPEP_0206138954 /NCGR_PEP_ID=MMETSP1473-20131121/4020_1 /ASSEMBLY_ACC=CAM_ASM_001109 /TAXON_ID=1461547 /ORGANISM="Stichococcus sp, Strain RCC1054" /LENGTH=129 /DNA_ID=CAMNT_0053532527 /DNA_START=185 /DNA_END=574 /DNA_ORIENTATION=-